eukprot:TRINITY_DN12978_c0_g1_i1.p1 TRINITY_DN12978_c0_g1~~TRINITY_DN12978_c0_g1_i1.p1  ORF type:complete len:171 (-),score=21.91 TRINITY_DN12978_c0_g1_i1:112-624(-)
MQLQDDDEFNIEQATVRYTCCIISVQVATMITLFLDCISAVLSLVVFVQVEASVEIIVGFLVLYGFGILSCFYALLTRKLFFFARFYVLLRYVFYTGVCVAIVFMIAYVWLGFGTLPDLLLSNLQLLGLFTYMFIMNFLGCSFQNAVQIIHFKSSEPHGKTNLIQEKQTP